MSRVVAWFRGAMPTREGIERNRWLAPYAHRLLHTSLWRFNRRSVPRAVALGLFVAPIIPVAHTFVAALLALPTRANILVAIAMTSVMNPLTMPPFYYAAFRIGSALLGSRQAAPATPQPAHAVGWMNWVLHVTGPTALGTFVLATLMASTGYLAAGFVWRFRIGRRWRRRHA